MNARKLLHDALKLVEEHSPLPVPLELLLALNTEDKELLRQYVSKTISLISSTVFAMGSITFIVNNFYDNIKVYSERSVLGPAIVKCKCQHSPEVIEIKTKYERQIKGLNEALKILYKVRDMLG